MRWVGAVGWRGGQVQSQSITSGHKQSQKRILQYAEDGWSHKQSKKTFTKRVHMTSYLPLDLVNKSRWIFSEHLGTLDGLYENSLELVGWGGVVSWDSGIVAQPTPEPYPRPTHTRGPRPT